VKGTRAQTRFSKKHEHVNPKPDHRLPANRPSPFLRLIREFRAEQKNCPNQPQNQPAKIDQISLRENDRFSTLVLPVGTPVTKIGEAKANQ
jgi:hypothetical protein